jgi:hypothetical protein
MDKAQEHTLIHDTFTLIMHYQSFKNEQQMCFFAYEMTTHQHEPSPRFNHPSQQHPSIPGIISR